MIDAIISFNRYVLTEIVVAATTSLLMFVLVLILLALLSLPTDKGLILLYIYVCIFPFMCVLIKSLFPIRTTQNKLSIWSYLAISYFSNILFFTAALSTLGECVFCKGNINDIILYTIPLGSVHAFIYFISSHLWSGEFHIDIKKGPNT